MRLTPYWDGAVGGGGWRAALALETRRRAVRWGEACEEGTVDCLLSSYAFFARACVCHVGCEREPSPAHMRDCGDHPCMADSD